MTTKKIFFYIFYSILISAAYYGSGVATRPLIIPPTFAAPIWPAAGIATGVFILWGYRFIPAILVGEIFINLKFYKLDSFESEPLLILTYGLMLFSTIIRSALGAYLVKRVLGLSNKYFTLSSIIKLMLLAGVIPTFISSLFSTYALSVSNLLNYDTLWINFLEWWFGDMIGVFVILPIMFVIFNKPREIWKPRLFKTAVPVIFSFLLLLSTAIKLKKIEHNRLVNHLTTSIDLLSEELFQVLKDKEKLHNLSQDKLIQVIDDLYRNNAEKISNIGQLKDIHFIITSKGDNGDEDEVLFESSNKFKKSKKWRSGKSTIFSNHTWEVYAYSTLDYFLNKSSWLVWWLLSIGFIFISLLGGGLLVITGTTLLFKDKVKERTSEIETLNEILIESENKYKQLIEIQPVIFWRHKLGEPRLNFISSEAVNLLGYSVEELMDMDTVMYKMVSPLDIKRVQNAYLQGAKTQDRFEFKYRAIKKNGEQIWLKDYVTTNKINSGIELIGLKIDITKEEEKEQEIAQLAYYDTMTKLPNRVKFMEHLQLAIKDSINNDTYGAVLYLDLDRFKVLNDSMGHYFGDKLLIQIAQRLKNLLRETDVSSRFGGDEFVVLMQNNTKELEVFKQKALHLANKIQSRIKEPFIIDGHGFYTTFSVGISVFPSDSDNSEGIIQKADIAMYESKKKGNGLVGFFEQSMQAKADRLLIIEKSLKVALENQHFEMYYQPIFDKHKKVKRLESLIRWNHPDEGLLFPDSFIPIAEETGFIIELNEWVVDDVFKKLSQIHKNSEKTLPISINISLFQFQHTKLVEILSDKLEKYSINPALVILELTESIGIDNFEDALNKLNELKELGIQIAIDDFGSGYSSLKYLTQMPFDIIKLDKSFVFNLDRKTNSKILVETIVSMSRKLRLDIIVEGVETEEQFELLIELGCDLFQGHLLSKALPYKAINILLTEEA